MSKPTEGPYIAWDDGRTIGTTPERDGFSIAIAEIVDHGDMADEAQLLADQRLLASAWSMRQALKQAEHWLQAEADSPEPGSTRPDEILRVIREAIAKAEGGDTALDTPEAIIANTQRTMSKGEELCPDCSGLGAGGDGDDCGRCHGGGSISSEGGAA